MKVFYRGAMKMVVGWFGVSKRWFLMKMEVQCLMVVSGSEGCKGFSVKGKCCSKEFPVNAYHLML